MLDYFKALHEKQPHRTAFIGILSNLDEALVYEVVYDEKSPKVVEYSCPFLLDAIIFTERSSNSQLKSNISPLHKAIDPKFKVLAIGKHHFLLSAVKLKDPRVYSRLPHRTRQQTGSSQVVAPVAPVTPTWFEPVRHPLAGTSQFVLKISHDDTSMANEIAILKKLRCAASVHIPELVWVRGFSELGILPIGVPVVPGGLATISRKVVHGMIEGLKYLHGLEIVHRDIRLSNLILTGEQSANVVIIDYETAFDGKNPTNGVQYQGRYICWPRRLLLSKDELYIPDPVVGIYPRGASFTTSRSI